MAKRAKIDGHYVGEIERRAFDQAYAIVRIADLCRADGGILAQQVLDICDEILIGQQGPRDVENE